MRQSEPFWIFLDPPASAQFVLPDQYLFLKLGVRIGTVFEAVCPPKQLGCSLTLGTLTLPPLRLFQPSFLGFGRGSGGSGSGAGVFTLVKQNKTTAQGMWSEPTRRAAHGFVILLLLCAECSPAWPVRLSYRRVRTAAGWDSNSERRAGTEAESGHEMMIRSDRVCIGGS